MRFLYVAHLAHVGLLQKNILLSLWTVRVTRNTWLHTHCHPEHPMHGLTVERPTEF